MDNLYSIIIIVFLNTLDYSYSIISFFSLYIDYYIHNVIINNENLLVFLVIRYI